MKTLKKIGPGTYAVPKNKLGVFAVHCEGTPPSANFIKKMIDGPLTAMEPKLLEELAKPLIIEG